MSADYPDIRDYNSSYREDDAELENALLWEKLEKVGKKISFAKDLMALGRYLKDPYVSWQRKAVVSAALIYFVSPVDKIKDLKPLFDILEELRVMEALLRYLGSEIVPYYDPDFRS